MFYAFNTANADSVYYILRAVMYNEYTYVHILYRIIMQCMQIFKYSISVNFTILIFFNHIFIIVLRNNFLAQNMFILNQNILTIAIACLFNRCIASINLIN